MASENIDEELDLLYRAIVDPRYLEALLTLIRRKTHSTSGTLQVDDYRTMEVIDGYFQGFSVDALVPYKEYYCKKNVLTAAAAKDDGLFSKIFISDQLISLKAFKASEFYNDWVKPEVGTDYSIWLSLNDRREKIIKLTLQRQAGSLSYSMDHTYHYLKLLQPHLKSAVRAMQFFGRERLSNVDLRFLKKPAVLINSAMQCRVVNNAFQDFLAECQWMAIGANEKLKVPAVILDELKMLLGVSGRLEFFGEMKRDVFYCHEHQGFIINIMPYKQDKLSILHPDTAENLLLLTVEVYQRQLNLPLLRAVFGLTEVEANTVVMLFEGKSIQEISMVTGRSLHTVRSLLKIIFHKCGVNRQAELVAKVAASLAYR